MMLLYMIEEKEFILKIVYVIKIVILDISIRKKKYIIVNVI